MNEHYEIISEMLLENYSQFNGNEIDGGAFSDIVPGATFRIRPELPEIRYKRGKTEYVFTDFRLLNPIFYAVICSIIERIKDDHVEDGTVSIPFSGFSIDAIKTIVDVVTAFKVHARKRGKNGFESEGCFLTYSANFCEDEVKFDIPEDRISIVKRMPESLNLWELMEEIVDEQHERMREYCEKSL